MNGSSGRILVVDDNESDVDLLGTAIEELGAPVALTAARGGQEAIDLLASCPPAAERPDLVLLDLNMPGVTGFEVLEFIRASAALRELTVVVMTTSMRPQDRERCLATGASGYVVKPRRFSDYLALMRTLFAQHLRCAHG